MSAGDGQILLDVLRAEGLGPEAVCGGHGTCGKCRVLADREERLACQVLVDRDLTVELPETGGRTNVLIAGDSVEVPVNPVKRGWLLAVDIGTTTVAGYLLDEDGTEAATASMLNPQVSYGADVISRIQAALGGEEDALTGGIREGLSALTLELCEKAGIPADKISVVSVVANPCMQQLFLGILPENLAGVPFAPVLVKAGIRPAAEILSIWKNAELLTVPDLSGYIGADTVGCVVSTGMDAGEEITLMVDIGTNGEMVLGNRERMTACSTAAGPALEGARITFGMRCAPGAIDHVWAENGRIRCSVVPGREASGFCGSGLIDAVAVLMELGLVNQRGRLKPDREVDGERVVYFTDSVYLTQNDIREIQMAKGAIAAGIELMAQHLKISLSQISRVLLAGAFGTYIRPESACRIGLLPAELLSRIRPVGNAAGSGAKILACNAGEFWRTDELVRRIEFLELASLPGFRRTFAKNMHL